MVILLLLVVVVVVAEIVVTNQLGRFSLQRLKTRTNAWMCNSVE